MATPVAVAAPAPPAATFAAHQQDARRWLAHELRGWLNTSTAAFSWSQVPLLPRFPAQLNSAIRALLVMGATAAFLLNPSTATILRGSVLLPVSAVICIQSNLGASLQTAYRVTAAAIFALVYNLFIINVLPTSIYVAIPAVAIAAFLISYTEAHALTKRFCLAGIIVCLLNSYDSVASGVVDNLYCMEVSGCIAVGALLGLVVQLLPLPAVPTAANEVIARMLQLSRSLHNQIAALALAFTHTGTMHVIRAGDAQARLQVVKEMVTVLDGDVDAGAGVVAEAPADGNGTTPDDATPARQMSSMGSEELLESLQAGGYASAYGERTPMMRADVEDMHALERVALPLLTKSVADMAYEPTAWLRPVKRAVTNALFAAMAACRLPVPAGDGTHGGLAARLQTWAVSSNRLHRIVRAMMVAEQEVRASRLHAQFLHHTQHALCRLVLASAEYHAVGLRYACMLHIRSLACCDDACGGTARRQLEQLLSARRDAVEDALTHFFECFQRARVEVLYNENEILGSRRHILPGASIDPPALQRRHGRPAQAGWHAKDMFAVMSYYFTVLRSVQTVMATVHATCALSGVSPDATHASIMTIAAAVDGVPTVRTQQRAVDSTVLRIDMTAASHATHRRCCVCCAAPQYTCLRCAAWIARTCERIRSAVQHTWAFAVSNLGLHVSWRQLKRAVRVSLGVTVAAILGEVTRYAFGSTFVFWAPVTVAFMSGGSEGGSYRTSVLRLVGTLVGASFGYVSIKLSSGDRLAVGILLSFWVAAMQFPRTSNIAQGYWAIVAAFTAAIIVLGAGGNNITASSLALTRIEQTWLGIVVYVVVFNGILPVSARQLVRTRVVSTLAALDAGMTRTLTAFIDFVTRESVQHVADAAPSASTAALSTLLAAAHPAAGSMDPQHDFTDPTTSLLAVDAFEMAINDLLDEAAAEPDLWRPQFATLHARYTELARAVKRTVRGIRLLYQCLVALRAQARMFAAERRSGGGRDHGIPSASPRSRGLQEQGLHPAAFTAENAHAVDSTAYYDHGHASSHGILAFSPFVESIQRLQAAAHAALLLVIDVVGSVDAAGGASATKSPASGTAGDAEGTPDSGTTGESLRTLSTQAGLDPVAALAAAVDKLVGSVVDYVEEYNEFMHSHIVAVVVKHRRTTALRRGASLAALAVDATPSSPAVGNGGTPGAADDANAPPWLLLSNLDSLCMSTSSFALRETANGIAEIARIVRRTHHARVQRFDK